MSFWSRFSSSKATSLPHDQPTNSAYIANDWIREVKIKMDRSSKAKNVGKLKKQLIDKINIDSKKSANARPDHYRDIRDDDILLLTIRDGQISEHWNDNNTDITIDELPNNLDCKGMNGLVAYLKKNWTDPFSGQDKREEPEHEIIIPVAFSGFGGFYIEKIAKKKRIKI